MMLFDPVILLLGDYPKEIIWNEHTQKDVAPKCPIRGKLLIDYSIIIKWKIILRWK